MKTDPCYVLRSKTVTLIGPPRPQARPRTFHSQGRTITWSPKEAHASYYSQLYDNRPKALLGVNGCGPLHVAITFYLPRPAKPKFPLPVSRPDLDNLAKPIMDAMNKTYFKDDSQVINLFLTKLYTDDEVPKTEVFIKEVGD